jgi:hypothetical protein
MKVIIAIMAFLILGCSQSESPKEIYDRYVQLEISGITVEQFISSYSKRKQEEIENAVKDAMKKNSLNRKQTIETYLPIFQRFAKCKNLVFLDEKIDDNKAVVSYRSTDDCAGGVNVKKEIIYMVNEDGWKIDDNDIEEL